jgi:hypothetical protein
MTWDAADANAVRIKSSGNNSIDEIRGQTEQAISLVLEHGAIGVLIDHSEALSMPRDGYKFELYQF